MLVIENLYKTFNANTVNEKRVIEGLSLTINDGDFITVIGGNGAGKSTLLNLISGSILSDEGSIKLNGKEISNLKEYQRASMIGRVFQDPMTGTCADLSIVENFSLAARRGKHRSLKKGLNSEEKKYYQSILKDLDLNLDERINAKVGLLSGGQRQALTLLMSALVKPELLLLDEHTAALDPKTAAKVLELTDSLVKKHQLSTLMITHNMKDALKYGNRLIMMSNGKVVVDISEADKKNLSVSDLLKLFESATGSEVCDRMVLK